MPRKTASKKAAPRTELGVRAEELRKAAGLSQKEAAARTDGEISQTAISAIENGRTKAPAGAVINKLAEVYRCLPEEFYPEPHGKSMGLAEFLTTPPARKLTARQRSQLEGLAKTRLGRGSSEAWFYFAEGLKKVDEEDLSPTTGKTE